MCGRPVFEPAVAEQALETAAAVPPALPPTGPRTPTQLPVSFSNPIALRVAFLMSLGITLMTIIQALLSPIWWLAAGLCAVLLYQRLTGLSLSVRAGVLLGSITGVLAFISLVILLALAFTIRGNELFQEMLKQNPQLSEAVNNQGAIAFAMLFVLLILFALVVGTCAAGGALGVRFASRNAKV